MVAEVCLGKVGAVATREVSRFARNSWSNSSQSRCAALLTRSLSIKKRSMRDGNDHEALLQWQRLFTISSDLALKMDEGPD